MATELVKYNAAIRALAAAKRSDEVLLVRDQAAHLRLYAKQAKDHTMVADAEEIRLRAERRLGELIAEQKKTVGLAKGVIGRSKKGLTRGSAGAPRVNEPPTLAQAGIDKKLSSRSQRLAQLPADRFETVVESTRDRMTQQAERVAVSVAKPVTTGRTVTARKRAAPVFDERRATIAVIHAIKSCVGHWPAGRSLRPLVETVEQLLIELREDLEAEAV